MGITNKNFAVKLITGIALIAVTSHADVVVSGDIAGGTGVFEITEDISFEIEQSHTGGISIIFDEFVSSDGNLTIVALTPQSLAYSIDGGASQDLTSFSLIDNYTGTNGALSPNDGYIYTSESMTLADEGKFTIFSGSWSILASSAFNSGIGTFTGNALLVNSANVS